jgi:hypothetical protein
MLATKPASLRSSICSAGLEGWGFPFPKNEIRGGASGSTRLWLTAGAVVAESEASPRIPRPTMHDNGLLWLVRKHRAVEAEREELWPRVVVHTTSTLITQ